MASSVKEFKRNYLKALNGSNAAIFAGAGLSKASGYVNWKELLSTIAEDLGLDVDKEDDLIAVAQYHLNEKQSRGELNQLLMDEFSRDAELNDNHKILAGLPIDTYWTTNYDHLIEESLKRAGKRPDIKITQENLALNSPQRGATVYKMHGDILYPSEAVLTKDDYESYNIKRELFTTKLRGDLVSKTFLFVGFSFEDPNLDYILSRIRVLLGQNQRPHYCFFKKVERKEYKSDEDFIYARTKQDLKLKDLNRYCINAVLVDSYPEITSILEDIARSYKRGQVVISGSAAEFGHWDISKAGRFIHELSRMIIKKGYKVVSGYGLSIGSFVINGALDALAQSTYKHLDECLTLRPFPLSSSGDSDISVQKDIYRQKLMEVGGVSVYIFGNKQKDGKIVNADGMLKEFEIAKQLGHVVIPVGSTGYAAREVWEQINDENKAAYPALENEFELLNTSTDEWELIEAVIKILKTVINGG